MINPLAYVFSDAVAMITAATLAIVLSQQSKLRTEFFVVRFAAAIAALFFIRIAHGVLDWAATKTITYLVVASFPLLALLTAESLMRRHAARFVKLSVAMSSLTIAVLAFVNTDGFSTARVSLIGAALILSLSITACFVIFRDAKELLPNENARLASLLLGFGFLIPLAATDFMFGETSALPALSALGAMCLLLAAIRVVCSRSSLSGYFIDITITIGLTVITSSVAYFLISPTPHQFGGLSLVLGVIFLAVICAGYLRGFLRQYMNPSLSTYLANARISTTPDFLSDLKNHRLIKSSKLLEGEELTRRVAPEAIALLSQSTLLSRADLERIDAQQTIEQPEKAVLSLLIANEMTHAIQLSQTPMKILLCESISPSGDRLEEADLLLLARLAKTIDES